MTAEALSLPASGRAIAGSAPAVRLEKLGKQFGAKWAVREVSFEIQRGSICGLIGPNGAGKTTTFSMIAGYLKPTEGDVRVFGEPAGQVSSLRGRVGVVPQDALLPAGDRVGACLIHWARLQGMGRDAAEQTARRVLTIVDGSDWWAQKCGTLSHGMAKRVALAQALLGDPELVLLDEPTAGLDPKSAYEVRQLVAGLRGRCTVVVSSHNLNELEQVCDSAAILDQGRLVLQGSMGELTATSQEVRIQLGEPLAGAHPYRESVPFDELRALTTVKNVDWIEDRRELALHFDPKATDAEGVIGDVLRVLLQHNIRISGVQKGRGLEQRVLSVT